MGSHSKPKPVTSIDEPLKGPKIQGQQVSKPSRSEDFWTTSACDMDNSAVQSRGSISSISTSNLIMETHGSSSANTSSEFVNHGKFGLLLFTDDLIGWKFYVLFVTCLLLWNQNRQQWIGNKKPENRAQQLHEPKLRIQDSLATWFVHDYSYVSFFICAELYSSVSHSVSAYAMKVTSMEATIAQATLNCLCMVKKRFSLCSWNATYESLLGSSKPFSQPVPLAEMVDFLVDIWEQEGMYD
ncbi:hypothetical protein RHMOL_Rhmol08G0287000 [Rhododendron molle]|uniref:Uncharacterized protein n=1 Tax=Rhododendron molle TaxID=49168 RepID=A0ACC0MTE5_RHOML|nr:hypothetical protein RHMOL_Rhmol08G0287000 [Rhododendron molle]